jgi:hypothetical protein
MASAAEQLANSINFGAFSKATELKSRIETLEKLVQGLAKAQGAAEPQR